MCGKRSPIEVSDRANELTKAPAVECIIYENERVKTNAMGPTVELSACRNRYTVEKR
jgi:hypothetical protein